MKKTQKSRKAKNRGSDVLPASVAVLPMREVVALPGAILPVYINRNITIAAVDHALASDRYIVLCLQRSSFDEKPTKENLVPTATLAKISSNVKLPSGEVKIRLHVLHRVKIKSFTSFTPFVRASIAALDNDSSEHLSNAQQKLLSDVKEKLRALSQYEEIVEDILFTAEETFSLGALADLVASALPLDIEESQQILEETRPNVRLKLVDGFLNAHLDLLATKERISTQVRQELSRSEHEHILREQLRHIRAELGESSEDGEDEIGDLRQQLENLAMPQNAKREATKQLRRLQQLHPDTSEAALARTYLDWMVDLPWSHRSTDRLEISRAKKILDDEHYGLDETKERILDFLGVRKLRKELRGPILLLVGPPGVGKTSLGRSIAKALGRQFVRVSVGGLRDEAELRGHRRTYVGAMPGRIIQGLKTAGTKNPVFMLDELDKVGSDFRGDPASVLLEILDPEQNREFEDHYLNIPFDLSEVMFICTANVTDSIPEPLLDRMEVIEIAGYTNEEKLEISKRYLIPREKEENGLKTSHVKLNELALNHIISGYTRESGVRELGRTISSVFRKVARTVAEGARAPRVITPKLVEQFLGVPAYTPESRLVHDQVGVVCGLAWTSVGGEIMLIEASMTRGKGALSLTGQIGDVMRESAMAALTYVLANAVKFGFDPEIYENSNVHIHIPYGAIPKDGPSAGITIATALVSLFTNTPVSRNVAMTGEITLRGNMLGIGGLKEKALAALRLGIPVIVIPKENKRDLTDLPKYLLDKVSFVVAENVEDALEVALVRSGDIIKSRKRATKKTKALRI